VKRDLRYDVGIQFTVDSCRLSTRNGAVRYPIGYVHYTGSGIDVYNVHRCLLVISATCVSAYRVTCWVFPRGFVPRNLLWSLLFVNEHFRIDRRYHLLFVVLFHRVLILYRITRVLQEVIPRAALGSAAMFTMAANQAIGFLHVRFHLTR